MLQQTNPMASTNINQQQLKIVSFNMHGYNQGSHALHELISDALSLPAVFMLQEHWLTPAAMSKFDDDFPDYFCFGCSAMTERVESGMLFGRPFGGVAILTHKSLRGASRTIHCEDRFAIVKIYKYIQGRLKKLWGPGHNE